MLLAGRVSKQLQSQNASVVDETSDEDDTDSYDLEEDDTDS